MSKTKHLLAVVLLAVASAAFADVNVGVFLPFKAGGQKGQSAVEYYRGLLMAVDSLSQGGTTFHITAADCGSTASDVKALLDEAKHGVFDIIFAPSNAQQAEAVNNYSILNGTKVVMPFGGRYDELITNSNYYALKVTQTDYTIPAYELLAKLFKGRKMYVVSTNGGTQICPLANFMKKYVKGVKVLEWPAKEQKILQAMADGNAVVVPSMYDEQTQKTMMQLAAKAPGTKAALIGYTNWYDRATTAADARALGEANVYIVTQDYPRQGIPRVNNFVKAYHNNFGTSLPSGKFSVAMWGFDSGYYLLKGLARYKRDFSGQPLYAAPLQNRFRFERRNSQQGFINTSVLLLHYKADGSQEIIEQPADQ
jgi:hypothetical protein